MSLDFEELAWRRTPIGEISLRRRMHVALGVEVFEVKLDDDFLMSSLFTAGEIALADLGLAPLHAAGTETPPALDVVVGGLGLGFTARAVLDDPAVRSLLVIEALPDIIDWHRRGLVPLGSGISGDPRCSLLNGDFFGLVNTPSLDTRSPDKRFHAILVDIDHSPSHVLHADNAPFYTAAGLRQLATHLHPGGVFALWSNDPPEEPFNAVLAEVFAESAAHVVRFPNPLQNREATNTIYVARQPLAD
jgi:spermidine synthase